MKKKIKKITSTWKQAKDYSDILMQAAIIAKDRQAQYGSAVESMQLACDILNISFGIKLTVSEMCKVMVALKQSRLKFKYKEDSMIDSINYTAIAILYEQQKKL